MPIVFTGEAMCAGCLCTSAGWCKYIEPPRTFSNHSSAEIPRCVECCYMSSEWFDSYGTFSSYIFTEETRCAGCSYTRSVWFKRIEPPRTISNHIMTEIAGRVEFFHRSSGWFDGTEPSLPTSLQGQQCVQGARALVRGGSSASNLLEPSRTTSSQR